MASWLKGRAEYAKLIEKYDTFLFDCDGVLWNGDHIIQGAAEVLEYLRSKRRLADCEYWGQLTDAAAEKSIIFVTNNASKSRQDYKSKFDKLGIQAEVVRVCSSSLICQNRH